MAHLDIGGTCPRRCVFDFLLLQPFEEESDSTSTLTQIPCKHNIHGDYTKKAFLAQETADIKSRKLIDI